MAEKANDIQAETVDNLDVKRAYEAIKAKQEHHTETFQYYDGDHPMVFSNERLRKVFGGTLVNFVENWCSVVIDTCKERIELTGFQVPDSAKDTFTRFWNENQLSIESDYVHEAALVTSESYLIVWPNENNQVEAFYNDPRLCHAFYESGNPRKMRMAAKMWVDEDEKYRLTLYYPDRLEYYRTTKPAKDVTDYKAFIQDVDEERESNTAENEYGEIPVFHFKMGTRGYKGDLKSVIPIQNAVNKLLSDMIVAAEFSAFMQRWVISNGDIGKLKNSPNEIWQLPAGAGGEFGGQPTSVGAFPATDLDNFLKAMERESEVVGRITRTPRHYFYSTGGDPSGEALIAMESPLNKKAKDRIELFEPVWRQAIAFALKISGLIVDPADIKPIWDSVETIQPKTQAEIRVYNKNAGIPLITQLKNEGWTNEEIGQMLLDKAKEESLGDQLLADFESGNQVD